VWFDLTTWHVLCLGDEHGSHGKSYCPMISSKARGIWMVILA